METFTSVSHSLSYFLNMHKARVDPQLCKCKDFRVWLLLHFSSRWQTKGQIWIFEPYIDGVGWLSVESYWHGLGHCQSIWSCSEWSPLWCDETFLSWWEWYLPEWLCLQCWGLRTRWMVWWVKKKTSVNHILLSLRSPGLLPVDHLWMILDWRVVEDNHQSDVPALQLSSRDLENQWSNDPSAHLQIRI